MINIPFPSNPTPPNAISVSVMSPDQLSDIVPKVVSVLRRIVHIPNDTNEKHQAGLLLQRSFNSTSNSSILLQDLSTKYKVMFFFATSSNEDISSLHQIIKNAKNIIQNAQNT